MITDFDGLNFTLGNEDVSLEWQLAPSGASHVAVVAGSGVRVLALAARRPKLLTCVDMADEQLWITELRVAAARELSYTDYCGFWEYPGFAMAPEKRRALFLRLDFSVAAREFCEAFLAHHGWRSVLYQGKWETLQRRTTVPHRMILGQAWKDIFASPNRETQRAIARRELASWRWRLAIGMTSASMRSYFSLFRKRLPELTLERGFLDYFTRAFSRSMTEISVRRALILQLMFCGRLECLEAAPVEAWPEVFADIQAALRGGTEVRFLKGDVLEVVPGFFPPVDFLSLSNVPTYFSGELERSFLQRLRPALAPGGVVVYRADLHVPRDVTSEGFERLTEWHAAQIAGEGTQLYAVEVFRRPNSL